MRLAQAWRRPRIRVNATTSWVTSPAWRTFAWLSRAKLDRSDGQRHAGELVAGERGEDRVGELEELLVHHAPPKTSTPANRQAGLAWPTRMTWLGSPLPQNGVPMTSNVDASPTPVSDRQNVALMPR